MTNQINKVLNRLRLASELLIRGEIPVSMREHIPSISINEIEEVRSFFPLDKFFIFGHARSGTTLLTRLVRLHSDVYCNYQGHFFTRQPTIESLVNTREIEAWFSRRSNRWNRGSDLSSVIPRVVVDFILEREARPLGAKIVGDKSPNSLLNGEAVKLMHKVYPDGKLIFIVRDGRDAAISHRFQTFIDAVQHLSSEDIKIRADFERDPTAFLDGTRSIFTETGIHKAASGWVDNVRETDHQARELFNKQYLALRYEDLLADPWTVMNQVWDFLGANLMDVQLREKLNAELASNPDKEWQMKKESSLVIPLHKGKSGTWQTLFTAKDKAIFKKIAGEILMTWGYEKDLNW